MRPGIRPINYLTFSIVFGLKKTHDEFLGRTEKSWLLNENGAFFLFIIKYKISYVLSTNLFGIFDINKMNFYAKQRTGKTET